MSTTIRTGIDKAGRDAVARSLSRVLADSYALYLKTHGFHWNIRGPGFFGYHNLLELQYRELWAALDVIAERIRALGELAPQGYAAFANLTGIKDGDPSADAETMIRTLMRDHETAIATLREGLKAAGEAGDDATTDLFTQRLAAHEKAAWMLRSSLGSA